MLTAHDIASKKFERAKFGGYRTDDVDNFLNEVADSIDQYQEKISVSTKQLEVLAEKLEEYRSDEESLRAALLGAQKLGDSVIRESKNKSEIILRDANIKAERILNTAKEQIEKEKMIYLRLQKDVAGFKTKMLAVYKQHLELISSLPDNPGKADERNKEIADEETEQKNLNSPTEPPIINTTSPEEQAQPEQTEEEPQQNEETDGEAYKEPLSKPFKHIPVPRGEDRFTESKTPYSDEYFSDFTEKDEQEPPSPNSPNPPKKKSKFGTLKFGAGYDLNRD